MTTWRTSKQKKEQVEPYDWYWVREVTGAEKRGGGYLGLLEEPWPSQAGASIFKCLHVQWIAGLPERDNYKERRGPALPYLPRGLQNAHFQLSWLPHNMWDMSAQAQVSPMQKPQGHAGHVCPSSSVPNAEWNCQRPQGDTGLQRKWLENLRTFCRGETISLNLGTTKDLSFKKWRMDIW